MSKTIITESEDWVSLHRVFQRARNFHKKEAKAKIEELLRSDALIAKADKIIIERSSNCYEFPNVKHPYLNRDPELERMERYAYDLAYGEINLPTDGSVLIFPGENLRFVWTGIEVHEELDNALLPFRDMYEVVLHPDENSLSMRRALPGDGLRRQRSRYLSDAVFERYQAHGVRCLHSSVEAAFPYSQEMPIRRKPGRPAKFPEAEAHHILAKIFATGPLPKKKAEAAERLKDEYQARNQMPSASTVNASVRSFYATRGVKN